jgi:shikimate kinase/3-dehydroquinate synthase
MKQRLFLIGLTGSGKTTLAPLVAARLGWPWVDLDHEIEARAGEPIPAIFARGVAEFRRIECDVLAEVGARAPLVVATGGGAILEAQNWAVMRSGGTVVALDVAPEIAIARVTARGPFPPLLVDDPVAKWHRLRQERAEFYAQADFSIDANHADPAWIAARIVAGLAARGLVGPVAPPETIPVALPRDPYAITVGWGALATVGQQIAALGLPPRVALVTDATVADLFVPGIMERLGAAGITAIPIIVPAGEASKRIECLSAIYDALLAARFERDEAIVALGGGVVGDLAGFAAATYLRGVPLVHIPTTLLAQVDASIGGKTGINHPQAKNAIGAFYQPRAVIADPAALLSLDARLVREGWGEIVKYAVALDGELFVLLEDHAANLLSLAPEWITPIIARCAALKARVVAADEREATTRLLLNYGHTIGHALEAVTGYGTLLHGEAVALGMAAEARIAARLGIFAPTDLARQDALCHAAGAPTAWPPVAPEEILAATQFDKKARGGRVRWVLPTALGAATIRADVPDELVLDVLRELHATP